MAAVAELGIDVAYGRRRVRSLIPFRSSGQHSFSIRSRSLRINSGGFWCGSINIQEFRRRLCWKGQPGHFFWGSFDLAVTRFSGRPAPERPGADSITRRLTLMK